ncbi:hypothetical protein CERSUDRAFT_115345 [Gelatoporia subvermispora B]|uniref:Uncharacterized protein n=1 Tax=Ceriporiopsis subvermispora (strain B) TaxID=914234 RepID=M2PJJ7_CERS8|nr:hypothetical protein CERSUDRAFT_115345 [Gelatoporia subvermispora B]
MHLQLKRSYTQHTRYPTSRLFDGSSSDLPSTHALTAGHTTEEYMVDLESGYSYYDKRARGHPWLVLAWPADTRPGHADMSSRILW